MGAIQSLFSDIDGTLVDSNDEHARSWVDAFAEFGKTYTFGAVRPLIGMGADKLLLTLGVDIRVDSDLGTALTARRRAIFLARYLQDVVGFQGPRELVQMLKRLDLQCVVTSSSSPEELEPLLAAAGVAKLFNHSVSPDEVKATKPDPDVILAALAWSKKSPEQTVMIGDTSYDIEAAHRAGVRCIALRTGGASIDALADADAIFDLPLALLTALQTTALDTLMSAGGRGRHPIATPAEPACPTKMNRYAYTDGRSGLRSHSHNDKPAPVTPMPAQ